MDGLDRWDWLLLLVGVYLAVMGLVRLMTARRKEVVAQLQQQWKEQQGRPGRPAPEAAKSRDDANG